MNCIVTAGPTYEPLDDVRRLTNFSTGRLGTELANFLAARGHKVALLIGETATLRRPAARAARRGLLHHGGFAQTSAVPWPPNAWTRFFTRRRSAILRLEEFSRPTKPANSPKSSRSKKFPPGRASCWSSWCRRPKIIAELRGWFPRTRIVGWKFEADGGRADALNAAKRQITECSTDLCVANGPAYGEGFGLVARDGKPTHLASAPLLFEVLEKSLRSPQRLA